MCVCVGVFMCVCVCVCKKSNGKSALHFTSLTDLFTQTLSRFLWETYSHRLQ